MKNRIKMSLLLMVAAVLTAGAVLNGNSQATVPVINKLVSENSSNNGQGGNGDSGGILSEDGKFAGMNSTATNLINGDTNGKIDVFVRNLGTNTTERASVSKSGVESNGDSAIEAISQTGRYVVFSSWASNLIDGETNLPANYQDFYVKDMQNKEVTMINKDSSGTHIYGMEMMNISFDGRFILATTRSNSLIDGPNNSGRKIVLFDRVDSSWNLVADKIPGDYQSVNRNDARMNCDGSFVAYHGDDDDIYIADRRTDKQAINITSGANSYSKDPNLSCNGRYVGFATKATNLVDATPPSDGQFHLVRYDIVTEEYTYIDQDSSGDFFGDNQSYYWNLGLTDDGDAVFQLVPTNMPYWPRLYIRKMDQGVTEQINRSYDGSSYIMFNGSAYISKDGKIVSHTAPDNVHIIENDTNGYYDMFTSETGW